MITYVGEGLNEKETLSIRRADVGPMTIDVIHMWTMAMQTCSSRSYPANHRVPYHWPASSIGPDRCVSWPAVIHPFASNSNGCSFGGE
jgi:hypothetical protein